jgi:3-oxoacyl-[acyl-carrier protein] reductase
MVSHLNNTGLVAGRIAAVTGASRGIGLAVARMLAANGAQVMMLGRDLELLRQRAAESNAQLGENRVDALLCDVADPDSVRAAFQAVFQRYRKLDVLVANAGVFEAALLGMTTPAQVKRIFDVNTFGVIYCAQYAARLMSKAGGGSIINMASIMGVNGEVGQAVYAGSKSAVIGITKSLAKELAASGVRVNAIAPGFIDTDMARGVSGEKFAERIASIRMGRIGTPDEVAGVALFLASDLAAYVTGQVIGVDGGMLV